MKPEVSEKLSRKPEEEIRVITHIDDVDGVVSGALILKKFPKAELEGGYPQPESFEGDYDFITDLPLPDGVKTTVWIDHHENTEKDGESEERLYDPAAKSAAGLVAEYLDMEDDELVPLAERADSVNYLTDAPTDEDRDYDPAWDVNDSVKAIDSEEKFVELVRTLAKEGVEGVRERFEDDISRTREDREKAEEIFGLISKELDDESVDAPIIISPGEKFNNMTIWGHIVFSLYGEGARACAVFFDDRCWLNSRNDFDEMNAGSIMQDYGGGGHKKSAGASIGSEKVGEIKEEMERSGLKPEIIDLREKSWREKLQAL